LASCFGLGLSRKLLGLKTNAAAEAALVGFMRSFITMRAFFQSQRSPLTRYLLGEGDTLETEYDPSVKKLTRRVRRV
jgi:hypothetical protein